MHRAKMGASAANAEARDGSAITLGTWKAGFSIGVVFGLEFTRESMRISIVRGRVSLEIDTFFENDFHVHKKFF